MWLLIAFIAVPIIEIALFIKVGGLIGLWPTLAIVLMTAVAGSYLLRRQGASTLAELQTALTDLRDPTGPIANGALILIGGVLLLTPGFFTDILGILLLIPPVRAALIRRIAARIEIRGAEAWSSGPARPMPDIIDADYEVITPEPGKPSGWTRH